MLVGGVYDGVCLIHSVFWCSGSHSHILGGMTMTRQKALSDKKPSSRGFVSRGVCEVGKYDMEVPENSTARLISDWYGSCGPMQNLLD